MDYQKIGEREQHWRSEVERLLNQAQQTDQEEDQRFGVGQPADPLPNDLANAQKRLQRLQQAKMELEREAEEQLQAVAALPCANVVVPAKRSKPVSPQRIASSARRRKSSANELERMLLRQPVNIISSIPTHG